MRVAASGISHGFSPGINLFENLSFELAAGDLVALTGQSGSGKSTLLGIISKWIKPNAGDLIWDGIDKIQWVFQNPHGPAYRTTLDLAALPLIATGLPRSVAEHSAALALSEMGLGDRAAVAFHELSGGEAQRLMLAKAIAASPTLLLVDEPTAQLDSHSAQTVIDRLTALASQERIVVIATHDPRVTAGCTKKIDLGGYQ